MLSPAASLDVGKIIDSSGRRNHGTHDSGGLLTRSRDVLSI